MLHKIHCHYISPPPEKSSGIFWPVINIYLRITDAVVGSNPHRHISLYLLIQICEHIGFEKILNRNTKTVAQFLMVEIPLTVLFTVDYITPLMLHSLLMEIFCSRYSPIIRSLTVSSIFIVLSPFIQEKHIRKSLKSLAFWVVIISEEAALEYFVKNQDDPTFGNARGVRNLFDRVVMTQATRILNIQNPSATEFRTIKEEDIV